MPSKDERTRTVARSGKHPTSGRINVIYVNGKRGTQRAVVLGPGSTSGLKLRVGQGLARRIVDNVPAATSRTSVNCYVSRGM